jgi:hypothetical protein
VGVSKTDWRRRKGGSVPLPKFRLLGASGFLLLFSQW